MYFQQRSNIIFRDYNTFGYITDNRNFGYKRTDDLSVDIGDKIISQSGAIFFKALDRVPQPIECLIDKISKTFIDADIETIKKDAINFYRLLEADGFIVSGKTFSECHEKDCKLLSPKYIVEKKQSNENHLENDTQNFFDTYFNMEPQLTNLHIEIISQCNERCLHCYIPHENKISSINPQMFFNILDQCRNMNVLHITISGGEPFAHENFIDFLRKCNDYNFSVNVLSNLTLLNNDILEEIKKNHLLSIQTSLYSMDPNIHDAITQVKGSFAKTTAAILKLADENIPLQISCPIMKQNINSYRDVVEWGKKFNINVVSDYVIIAKYDHTIQNLNTRLSISDVEKLISEKLNNEPEYLKQIENEIETRRTLTPDDFICSVCRSSICISDNGNVYPCVGWQDFVVGNINKTSLNEIWKSSIKVKKLRDLRRRDFPQCLQCSEKEFCTMCMVRNANEHPTGNYLIVNEYFCNIAKLHKETYAKVKTKMS